MAEETVTITLKELQRISGSISALLSCELPITISRRISKLSKKFAAELTDISEDRNRLIKKYGEINEAGQFEVTKANTPVYNEEWEKYLEETIEMPVATATHSLRVRMSEIKDAYYYENAIVSGKPEKIKHTLTVLDVANLEPFIEDDLPEEKK